jgi:Putative glutamine amidotransferase
MSDKRYKVLLAGESWVTTATHIKGFDQFSTVTFHLGAEPQACAKAHGVDALLVGPLSLLTINNECFTSGFSDCRPPRLGSGGCPEGPAELLRARDGLAPKALMTDGEETLPLDRRAGLFYRGVA